MPRYPFGTLPAFGLMSATLVAATGLGALVTTLDAREQLHPKDQVQTLLSRARAALGGDGRLASVESFTASGAIEHGSTTSRGRRYGHFDLAFERPAALVLRTHVGRPMLTRGESAAGGVWPDGDDQVTTSGLDRGRLIYEPDLRRVYERAVVQRYEVSKATPEELRRLMRAAQEDFLRVTLGIFAASFDDVPVAFEVVADDPDAVSVTGAGEPVKLVFDPVSHLPARFGKYAYSDYRDVEGIKIPFTTVRTMGNNFQKWEVREFRINEPISPKVFLRRGTEVALAKQPPSP